MISLLFSITLSLVVFGSGEHSGHHKKSHRFGPDKAIVDVDQEKGFKLSKESRELLKIKTKKISIRKFKIPKRALVYMRDKKGYYVFRDDYFKFLEANQKPKDDDEIVVQGAGLVNITDIFSTDQSEYGHSH